MKSEEERITYFYLTGGCIYYHDCTVLEVLV